MIMGNDNDHDYFAGELLRRRRAKNITIIIIITIKITIIIIFTGGTLWRFCGRAE